MKRNEKKALMTLSLEELTLKAKQLHKEFMQNRIQHAGGRLQKSSVLKQSRHDLARILTIQTQKKVVTTQ